MYKGGFDCMYVCVPHVWNAFRGQKRAPDPLELELQVLIASVWMLGTNPGPLQEWQVLFTVSLVSVFLFFKEIFFFMPGDGGAGL